MNIPSAELHGEKVLSHLHHHYHLGCPLNLTGFLFSVLHSQFGHPCNENLDLSWTLCLMHFLTLPLFFGGASKSFGKRAMHFFCRINCLSFLAAQSVCKKIPEYI